MKLPSCLPGLSALLDKSDAFLVDQFGTLHDGMTAYPGAIEALLTLRQAGKRIAILSNSGKRNAANEARFAQLGFPRESYDVFLSSGEAAWRLIASNRPQALRDVRTCLLLSRGKDISALDGLGLIRVTRAEQADLVFISGSEADQRPLADYAEILRPAAQRGVVCLCTNPDRTMLVEGDLLPGAGQIAELYASLGGPVIWFGKPHRPIYDMVLEMLGSPSRRRVFGVGDSVEHDVAGAAASGCCSALVLTGIAHGMDKAALAAETELRGAWPSVVLRRFTF